MSDASQIATLEAALRGLEPAAQLQWLSRQFAGTTCFSTSFSEEDQLISHWIFTQQLPVKVFTLDTGRLFPETYSTWTGTLEKYQATIIPYYPDAKRLEAFVAAEGPNAFYASEALRKACCHIRKVEPLQRALAGQALWITGIRAEHSPNRKDMQQLEWDPANRILKFHPLLHWNTAEVKALINQENIPYNPLHDRGFVSIGCAPCTRAIKPGEDFRAGRWWWEDATKKECGLHQHATAS